MRGGVFEERRRGAELVAGEEQSPHGHGNDFAGEAQSLELEGSDTNAFLSRTLGLSGRLDVLREEHDVLSAVGLVGEVDDAVRDECEIALRALVARFREQRSERRGRIRLAFLDGDGRCGVEAPHLSELGLVDEEGVSLRILRDHDDEPLVAACPHELRFPFRPVRRPDDAAHDGEERIVERHLFGNDDANFGFFANWSHVESPCVGCKIAQYF